MAEGRMLKKRISKSRKLGALKKDYERILYLLLIPHLDCEGRLEANSHILKGEICPYIQNLTLRTIPLALKNLHKVGLIVLYENNKEKFLQLVKFHKFNRIDRSKEAPSNILPPTPEQCQSSAGVTPAEVNLIKVNSSKRKFVPPTLEEVQQYITKKGYDVNAQKFFDYFIESGWIDSKGNPVRNWKQKIITWSGNRNVGNRKTTGNRRSSFASQQSSVGETIED